jgi:hypothetical protein
MLLLSRKADQRIIIGGSIRITVLEARGPVVRLGIEAPDGIPIRCGDDPLTAPTGRSAGSAETREPAAPCR